MSSILWESSFGKSSKIFKSRRWKASIPPSNNSAETFWIVQTNRKLMSFLDFLKLENLFGNLTTMEKQFLYDSPGVLRDRLFIDALRAIMSNVPRKTFEERLEICSFIAGKNSKWNSSLLKTWRGTTTYRICLCEKPIRKAKKFSGWIRNPSAAGSKRFGKTKPEPETFEWNFDEEIDYYNILTVGEFPGTVGIQILSLMSPSRTKQKPLSNKRSSV